MLKVKTLAPSPVTEHEVTLRGSLDPDGITTDYYFKYGVDTATASKLKPERRLSGSGVTNLSAARPGPSLGQGIPLPDRRHHPEGRP